MSGKPEVYFGACDRQMEIFMDADSFRESLVYGLLFHGDLVVPDIFFYISTHLKEFILNDRLASNFIVTSTRHGAIIPAFRTDGTNSFRQNLDEIVRSNIQGVHPESADIARILDAGLAGKRLYSRSWPKEPVSTGYRRTLERVLMSQDILEEFPGMEKIWNITKGAREYVMGAIHYDDLGGIRRGDIYNLVHAHFNGTKTSVHDVTQIWADIPDLAKIEQAKRLIKWINYCYYYNQGLMIGLNPGFSALDGIDIHFARHLVRLSDGKQEVNPITQEFRLPSAAALLTVDPPYLFEVRDSQLGEDYFSGLATWRQNPTEDTSRALLDALNRYISAINRVYLVRGKNIFNWLWHLKAHVPPAQSRWGKTGVEALKAMASDALSEAIPHIGLTSIVGQVAATTYETMPATLRDKIGPPMGISASYRVDFEPTSKRVRSLDGEVSDASFVNG